MNLSRDRVPKGRSSLGKCSVTIRDLFVTWNSTLSNPDASDLSE